MKEKTTFFKNIKNNITRWDMIAIGVFLFLIAWYAYAVQTGMGISDESFYYTIPQRVSMGDRLFVDEWQISQLSSIFLYFPYRLYVLITGGNDGIVLFMRVLSVTVTLPVYWFIYMKLREHQLFAIIAAFLFCADFPGGVMVINYMLVPVYAIMVACLLLFTAKETLSWWKLIGIGLLIAVAVAENPVLVVVYIVFSILCLICAKKPNFLRNYSFVFSSKIWMGITIGCLIAFIVVVGSVIISSGFTDLVKFFPELFTDSEYDFSFGGGHMQRFFYKLTDASRMYGVIFTICSVAVCAVSAFVSRSARKKEVFRPILLICACLLIVAQIVHAIITIHTYRVNPSSYPYDAPGYALFMLFVAYFSFASTFFGLSCYLLCEKKDPRVFAFWLTGTMMSLCEMYSAQITMSLGGPISNVTMLVCMKQLWDEGKYMQQINTKIKRKSAFVIKREKQRFVFGKVTRASIAVALCAIVVWGSANFYMEGIRPYVETLANTFSDQSISQRFTTGPYKGIRTSAPVKKVYDDTLADLDEIAAGSKGEAVYVAGICPFAYLYLKAPIASYSAWYTEVDSETRQLRYWQLHPEKRPKYCYIYLYPDGLDFSLTWEGQKKYMDKKLAFLKNHCECSVKKGRAGYIVKVSSWKNEKA